MYIVYKLLREKIQKFSALAIVICLVMSVFVDFSAVSLFKASTLGLVKHAPFDGLSYPYQYAPDWVALNESERELAFNGISSSKITDPISYNPSELALPLDSLSFSDNNDIQVRNAKITYSVPYLGNYKLDGKEEAGSHPAVDIKLPIGTPILSIGNGVVIKSEDQPWGFGKHIVVRHNDFPDFDNSSKTTTYFASYSHMSDLSVVVGDIVIKSQKIGLSGDTGTATTPHLHFQIDKETAPWHPYWPFTATEAQTAGLSFFDAINSGLGKEIARSMTINPMLYVQRHLSTSGATVASATPSLVEFDLPAETLSLQGLEVIAPNQMILGEVYNVELKLASTGSDFAALGIADYKFNANLLAEYTLPQFLDFGSGVVNVSFEPKELGNMNITLDAGDYDAKSSNIEVRLFSDISNSDPDLKALKYLKDKSILTGFQDKSFKPDDFVTKAQASKLIVAALPAAILESSNGLVARFNDVSEMDWYFSSVSKLLSLGAIDPSKSNYEPNKAVTLGEFLKLLFESLKLDISPDVNSGYGSYFDVNAWYAPYLQEAIKQGVISTEDSKSAESSLNRRDVARYMSGVLQMVDNM